MSDRYTARLNYGIWSPHAGEKPARPTPVLDVVILVAAYALHLAPLVAFFL